MNKIIQIVGVRYFSTCNRLQITFRGAIPEPTLLLNTIRDFLVLKVDDAIKSEQTQQLQQNYKSKEDSNIFKKLNSLKLTGASNFLLWSHHTMTVLNNLSIIPDDLSLIHI